MSVQAIEDCGQVVKVAAIEIFKAIAADGFQWTDLAAFIKSPDFEAAVGVAIPEAGEVPAELVKLSFTDDFELMRYAYGFAMDLISALKASVKK